MIWAELLRMIWAELLRSLRGYRMIWVERPWVSADGYHSAP